MTRWRRAVLLIAAALAGLLTGAPPRAGVPVRRVAGGVVAVEEAWRHNLELLERYCARTQEPWPSIARGPFRQTVEYDDIEAHRVCQHSRGQGCAHGPCSHPALGRGCLNSRRDRCCDRHHKRCTILSRDSRKAAVEDEHSPRNVSSPAPQEAAPPRRRRRHGPAAEQRGGREQ